MYPAVKEYLKLRHGCETAYADLPSDEVVLRLPRNHCIREVDVVAVKNPRRPDVRVHLAEGKRLDKGHSFEECLSQLESVSKHGDYLWTFFPEQEWRELTDADRETNLEKLRKKGFGLLLVDQQGRCDELLQAPWNREVGDARRCEVLEALGLQETSVLPSGGLLSFDEARKAELLVCFCWKLKPIVENAIKEALNERRRCDWYVWGQDGIFQLLAEGTKPWYAIQIEPFGNALADGRPVMWVWVQQKDLKRPQDCGSSGFGTHVYLDPSRGVGPTILKQDFQPEVHRGDRYLGHRIELVGRTTEAVGRELAEVLRLSRRLMKTGKR